MSDKIAAINVMEVPLFNGTMNDAIAHVLHEIEYTKKNSRCISATGAHGMVTSKKDGSFLKVLKEFHINLPDGMPGVWVGKIKGAKKMTRCTGPDFFRQVMIETGHRKINHYFCGGKEGVAEELKRNCASEFNNRNIVGTFSPPFREMTDAELIELSRELEEKQTDILWIGISTPKQEKFALRISKFCKVHFIITVGAAFDFHIGRIKKAPKYLQRIGMEWFYRLCIEPKRLWKRYLETVPLFIYYNVLDFIGINKTKE